VAARQAAVTPGLRHSAAAKQPRGQAQRSVFSAFKVNVYIIDFIEINLQSRRQIFSKSRARGAIVQLNK
jgi:hypothetical protein